MKLYPVIMCGGAGTRLWPASRPSRPKQFIPLAGNRSLFHETVVRVAPLVSDGGRLIVVGGADHREWILDQLHEAGVGAQVLLEPEARDSAAAMAAAAAWTAAQDPEGVNIFVASDHHIPNQDAFRASARRAAEEARKGRIVTLGVKPTEPSAAYGYIHPVGQGLSRVESFVEKPDRVKAQRYIDDGYLWNSGNFIVSAEIFLAELASRAPLIERAARASVAQGSGEAVMLLGDAFRQAPKVSVDYAVMEKTDLASVLEVDFGWSDLGAWDSIAASGEGEIGGHIFEDAEGCLARAPDGILVAAIGVRDLAIIVEPDAVLVCDLARSQEVKKVVERIRTVSPQHADFPSHPPEALAAGATRFRDWLRARALPLWSTLGQRDDGAFAEVLALDGRRVDAARRARVQARQIYVFARAGLMGWEGPWKRIVAAGLENLEAEFVRADGQMRTRLTPDGSPLDERAMVYDQAFLLLALATALKAGVGGADVEARGQALLRLLMERSDENGALREEGTHPFQSNAHMHLLEAALAWEEVSDAPVWTEASDRIVELARTTFIDPKTGRLREFFDATWAPAAGEDGRLVEPGHQFEWAWLLVRYASARSNEDILAVARRLHALGREGVCERRRVAVNALNDDGEMRTTRARLWPQTEWLKSAVILANSAPGQERVAYLEDAAEALRALWLYLTPDGLWRDTLLENGKFIEEPSPASSLYHIVAAFAQLADTAPVHGGMWSSATALR
ncbi:AGE family epimerase/isomerase [Brevundimonas sp.]|uniref:AGE family epimerase/isomerase n=1 Tax=Brevundimonas sp. TaxID=1871086 RepID=UPI00289E7F5A|nr:AGE family epimerase/isomerase [Brevundimonas sp.]